LLATINKGAVTDAMLASSSNGIPRTVFSINSIISQERIEGFYALSEGASGSNVRISGSEAELLQADLFQMHAADYVVGGMNLRARVIAEFMTNTVKPTGMIFNVGAHPVEAVAGAANKLSIFQGGEGAVVTGEVSALAAGASRAVAGPWGFMPFEFNPSELWGFLVHITGAKQPAGSVVQIGVHLQLKWE
jgi:hypothetical protein